MIKHPYSWLDLIWSGSNTMTDSDGPCAFPQPNIIKESVAYPLAALGFVLISVSFFFALPVFNPRIMRRYKRSLADVMNNSRQEMLVEFMKNVQRCCVFLWSCCSLTEICPKIINHSIKRVLFSSPGDRRYYTAYYVLLKATMWIQWKTCLVTGFPLIEEVSITQKPLVAGRIILTFVTRYL